MAKRTKSPLPPRKRSPFLWLFLLVVLVAGAAIANHHYQWYPWPWVKEPAPVEPVPIAAPVQPSEPVVDKLIDYQKIKEESDPALSQEIKKRKDDFGLEKSVDMVVSEQESIRVGEETIPLTEILSKIEGKVIDPNELPVINLPQNRALAVEDLSENNPTPIKLTDVPEAPPIPRALSDYYGVYVVRAGDNLWDIHFAILREYLRKKGIDLADNADEKRTVNGRSTGVSRILKYAESMVHIFNMKTRTLSTNLGLLEPETKVVVLNLSHLNRILGGINPQNLDQVQYDGRELYLPNDQEGSVE